MTATALITPAPVPRRAFPTSTHSSIIYPESDGKPMADNTWQFDYIVMIQGGLATQFADRADVFVAGDLLWYPVEGNPRIRAAPDAMVVFGRPPGHRGSYIQHQEGGIAPQVAFEVLSPGNTRAEMARKLHFYERYGVQEYYEYDPDRGELRGWLREAGELAPLPRMEEWVSPLLGIRFSLVGKDLRLYHPDGQRFEMFVEQARRANAERQRADAERQRADAERQRAERLAERLRALGIDPDGEV